MKVTGLPGWCFGVGMVISWLFNFDVLDLVYARSLHRTTNYICLYPLCLANRHR